MFVQSAAGEVHKHIDTLKFCINPVEQIPDLRRASEIDRIKIGSMLLLPHELDKFLPGFLVLIGDAYNETALRQACHHRLANSSCAPVDDCNFVFHGHSEFRWPKIHHIMLPPFTITVWPVINAAASLAKNTAAPTRSSGCPMRPNGIFCAWA